MRLLDFPKNGLIKCSFLRLCTVMHPIQTKGKPMREVLSRLRETDDFDIVIFGDDCILNKPIEEVFIFNSLLNGNKYLFILSYFENLSGPNVTP